MESPLMGSAVLCLFLVDGRRRSSVVGSGGSEDRWASATSTWNLSVEVEQNCGISVSRILPMPPRLALLPGFFRRPCPCIRPPWTP